MTVQYDAKELATLVTSVMKVLRQKLNDCRDFFLVRVSVYVVCAVCK